MTQSSRRIRRVLSVAVASALSVSVLNFAAPSAHAVAGSTAYALSSGSLLSFDPTKPTVTTTTGLVGINAGETLVGIDVRPQNGILYGLGVNAATDTATLYNVSPETGQVTAVGVPGAIALTAIDGVNPVDLPDPAAVGYGIDFHPATDRLRVVAGSVNFRINPNTGAAVDSNVGTAGVNPDGNTNGAASVDAAAFTNNRANQSVTTLYTLDGTSNKLFIQNPANNGTQTNGLAVTLGGNPLDFTAATGFDIDDSVDAPASNSAVVSGSAYAILNVGGSTGLYKINLVNAQATLVGTIGNGTVPVQGLALQRNASTAGRPVIGLSADGQFIERFASTTPGTFTNVAVSAVAGGETLVALTWRPATGQLYGLGVNATANTATLYVVDPNSAIATAVGTPGQVAFTTDGATPVDLADPATTGYGMDINPTVDRVRVVTGDGKNFRIVPATGAPVDGDPGTPGVTTDFGLNGLAAGSVGLTAAAYTNSYGQPLGVGPTTLYGVDPTANQLTILNPPNAGTSTTKLALTLNGSPLDIANFVALDITREVKVATSNVVATGSAYAAFVVGGVPGIYLVDLATGKTTSVGTAGGGVTLRSIAVGQAQTPPPVVVPPKTPATLVKVAAAKQIRAKVDTGRVLKCPTKFATSSCPVTTKITVTSGKYKGKVLGKVTTTVARGGSKRLTVTLSAAGRSFLRAKRIVGSTIAITYPGAPGAKTKTVTFAFTLRKSKL